jgi:hypothetical protein
LWYITGAGKWTWEAPEMPVKDSKVGKFVKLADEIYAADSGYWTQIQVWPLSSTGNPPATKDRYCLALRDPEGRVVLEIANGPETAHVWVAEGAPLFEIRPGLENAGQAVEAFWDGARHVIAKDSWAFARAFRGDLKPGKSTMPQDRKDLGMLEGLSLRLGFLSLDGYVMRTIAIAKGERQVRPGEPKVWVESLRAFAQVLAAENADLLREVLLHGIVVSRRMDS